MHKALYPKAYLPSLVDIRIDWLKGMGIKGVLLDLDNTIVRRDSYLFTADVLAYLEELHNQGFAVGILSNSGSKRVQTIAAQLALPAVENAGKPAARAFRLGMAMLGTKPAETLLVGDQIFTDVIGGNRAGLHTVLVTPLPGKDFIGTRLITRPLERMILAKLVKNKELTYGQLD